MMKESDFKDYVKRLNLPTRGVDFLNTVRNGGVAGGVSVPARRVESHVGNSIVRFSSLKMCLVTDCESGVEFTSVLQMEHADDVLEFYSQPAALILSYMSPTGRKVTVPHTPDFLVLRKNGVEFRECKSVDGVSELVEKKPNRYSAAGDHWLCSPGQVAANVYGFDYKVWTPAELTAQFAANLRYLDPHFKRSVDAYSKAQYEPVVQFVEKHQGITLDALVAKLDVEGPALVRWMLTHGHLFCDLHRFYVAETHLALVYTTVEVAKAAESLLPAEQKWPVALTGTSPTPVEQASSCVTSVYLQYGLSALGCANRRLACIEGRDSGAVYSPRSRRHFQKLRSLAKQAYGNGYVGLIPHTANQGNRSLRYDPAVYELADAVIAELYLKTSGPKLASVYRVFCERCRDKQLKPPSHVWFWERVKQLRCEDVVAARNGPRAAYPLIGGVRGHIGTLGVHGDYPLQVVHIDHTQLDVEIRSSYSGATLGRPWLTVAFDAASRSVVGIYLSFDSPSIDSVLMVIRDLVLRNELLPFGFTVDNGAEFRSEWFEVFTGLHDIVVWRRPPHHARFGSVIENFFGVANSQFIHVLEGNTQLMKNVRQVTKSVNPANLAIWTLDELYGALETYCFEYFNRRPHAELGQAPADAFASLLKKHGVAGLRKQKLDDAFLIATMVPVEGGHARVQPARGVKVRGDYFYNEELAGFVHEDVPVRFDPMDPGRVFCGLNGKWVPCVSKYADRIAGLTVRQVQCWSEELRKRSSAVKNQVGIQMSRLGRFIDELKLQKEVVLKTKKADGPYLEFERAVASRAVLARKPGMLMNGTPMTVGLPSRSTASVASLPDLALQLFPTAEPETFEFSDSEGN